MGHSSVLQTDVGIGMHLMLEMVGEHACGDMGGMGNVGGASGVATQCDTRSDEGGCGTGSMGGENTPRAVWGIASHMSGMGSVSAWLSVVLQEGQHG